MLSVEASTGGIFRSEWYLDLAAGSPEFVRGVAAFATDAVLAVFAGMFVLVWWRARKGTASGMARALAAPVMTVLAYGVSEVVKNVWREDRPCRGLGEHVTIVACPEYGDWSFPSNHATLAGAAAIGIWWSMRSLGWIALGTAVLAAGSRVFVGVHYPHDVLAGLLLGGAVCWGAPVFARLLVPVVVNLRGRPALGWLLGRPLPGQGGDEAPTVLLPRVR